MVSWKDAGPFSSLTGVLSKLEGVDVAAASLTEFTPMRAHRKEPLLGARTTPVDVSAIMASILAEEQMERSTDSCTR